jgi:hypothetical protein
MSNIYISTTSIKAEDCFKPREEESKNLVKRLNFPSQDNCITRFEDSEIYFHYDSSNPNEIIINSTNDYIIKHSQSNAEFCSMFSMSIPSIHNSEESSKFRQVYKILIDDKITDKYSTIKAQILSYLMPQLIGQIGSQFLDGGIDIEQIKSLLKHSFTDTIESILNQNLEYQTKKDNNTNSKSDDDINTANWYKLEKALKASNG